MEQPRPVTAEDLARLKAELLEAFRETLHEMETRLFRAFFQYQEHADIKFRKISADVSNVNTSAEFRLNNLEQRVVEIEKRLMLGGAA
jgi:hypothetical protein